MKSIKAIDIVNESRDIGVGEGGGGAAAAAAAAELKEDDLFIKCFDLNYAFGKKNPVD